MIDTAKCVQNNKNKFWETIKSILNVLSIFNDAFNIVIFHAVLKKSVKFKTFLSKRKIKIISIVN